MSDTYRAMCEELVDELHAYKVAHLNHDTGVIARAREMLAQPAAEGPTDEEIMELMPQLMRDDLAAAARAMAGFNTLKAAGAIRIILNRHAVDHARVVLSHYCPQ